LSLMGACAVAAVGCRSSARAMPATRATSSIATCARSRFLMVSSPGGPLRGAAAWR
jgi:hypothetical protein